MNLGAVPPKRVRADPSAAFPVLRREATRAAPLLFVLGAWFLMHPYQGITHDAQFYVAQALRELNPRFLAQDLFFRFGSQDAYTLFPSVLAPLLRLLGTADGAAAATAAGHVLWLTGAAAFAGSLADRRMAVWTALFAAAVLPASYAGFGVFEYGEGFVTARLFAEGLTLWGLGLQATGRRSLALALLLLATALHPLMGSVGLCLWLLLMAGNDRRWLLAFPATAMVAIALSLADVAPFGGLFQPMDAEWRSVVESRNAYLFPMSWTAEDWARLAAALALAASFAWSSDGVKRRVALAVLATGGAGVIATILGGELLNSVLFIQAQPVRSTWIVQLFGNMALALLLVRLWERTSADRTLLAALASASMLLLEFGFPLSGATLLAAFAAAAAYRLRGGKRGLPPLAARTALVAAVLTSVLLFAAHVAWVTIRLQAADSGSGNSVFLLLQPTLVEWVLAGMLLLWLYHQRPHLVTRAAPAAAAALLVIGTLSWDRRDAADLILEQSNGHPLQRLIPNEATVYSEEPVRTAWLLLRRDSYFSPDQGAGVLFSRATALAYRDRARALAAIDNRELIDLFRWPKAARAPLLPLQRHALVTSCEAAPGLDFLLLSRRVARAYMAEWRLPVALPDRQSFIEGSPREPIASLFLYRCADLRR